VAGKHPLRRHAPLEAASIARTAIITGTSSGIGRATAELMAEGMKRRPKAGPGERPV